MIADKHLTFLRKEETPVTTTIALPMGQRDLHLQTTVPLLTQPGVPPKETSGMGVYRQDRLWVVAVAGEAVDAGFELTLQHANEETGTFTDLMIWGPTERDAEVGQVVLRFSLPFQVRNWIRFGLSEALSMDIFLTPDVHKWYADLSTGGDFNG